MTRSYYKAGVHKKGFAFGKLLFFSALKRNMNKANKINARYSQIQQAIQRNWQGYLRRLNKQQEEPLLLLSITVLWDCPKGHYLYIFKQFSTRMVQQNAWVVLLFNGKVGEVNIFSDYGSVVTNSYGGSWDSSSEKY